jgi:hydrogenase maturation protease
MVATGFIVDRGVTVIGVGRRSRGADAAGRVVADRLAADRDRAFTVDGCDGDALDLMDAWRDADTVLLVDAMVTGARPGVLMRFDASDAPLPAAAGRSSTHDLGLADAIELARALRRLPRQVIVYGIEADDFTPGAPLSCGVLAGVERAARTVAEEAARLASATGSRRRRRGEGHACTTGP